MERTERNIISINLFCFHRNARRRRRIQIYTYTVQTIARRRDHPRPLELACSKIGHTTMRRRRETVKPREIRIEEQR
jgi:hypothetical protein